MKTIIKGIFMLSIIMLAAWPLLAQDDFVPEQQPQEVEVSDAELNNFVDALITIQEINEAAQGSIVNAVENEGLSVEEFEYIYQAHNQGDETALADLSDQDEKQFQAALDEIMDIQQESQIKMQGVVADKGFEVERFNEIAMAMQMDQSLQQRIQERLHN